MGAPQTDADTVFLCCRAPFRAFGSHCAVSVIVDRAFARAGVTRPSRSAAHLLRHSVATSMLRHGASLHDVAALLRHRSVATTEIYAKVDVTALRPIAQPWPEAVMLAAAVTSYVGVRRAAGFAFRSQALALKRITLQNLQFTG